MPPSKLDENRLPKESYVLSIRQQPEKAKVIGPKEKGTKDRKPVDPPPIIQIKIKDPNDPTQNYLQSPYYFMAASLWHATEDEKAKKDGEQPLSGTVVSSLHRLKDSDNHDGGFFVFGDLSVKAEGTFRLKFSLYEVLDGMVISLQDVITNSFVVHSSKTFPGMSESSFLSRSFGDQGVRLRIRKETRQLKRTASPTDNPGSSKQHHGSISGHGNFSPSVGRDYQDYNGAKRQRSGPTGGMYDQIKQEPGAWPPTTGYGHDTTMAPMSYAMRPHATTDGSYMQRPQISDYAHNTQSNQQLTYDGMPRMPQDQASDQYSESQSSRNLVAPLPLHRNQGAAEHLSYMQELNTPYPTMSPTSNYPYSSMINRGTSTLPPLQPTASNGAVPASPGTGYNPSYGVTGDGRYATSRGQSNMQGTQGLNNFGSYPPSNSSYQP